MNTRKHTDPESFVDEREWQAQERAMLAERHGMSAAAGDDPLVARYRGVSRVLRQPLAEGPPPDLAASLARQVSTVQEAAEGRFERIALQVMTALLGLCVGVTSVLHGREWVQAITRAMPGETMRWVALIAACAGMHWALEQWRARRVRR